MAALYKAHMLQPDREHTEIYLEAISPLLVFEALEFAVKESIRLDDRFPKVPRLLELAKLWKPPVPPADLSRTALPEGTYSDPAAEEAFKTIMAMFGNDWRLSTTRRAEG